MAQRTATFPTPQDWQGAQATLERPRRRFEDFVLLAFFFIAYANLAVVASHYHGMSSVLAPAVVLLLLVPLARYLVLERQPLVVTPVLPLAFAFLGALFLAAALSKDPGVSQSALGTYLTEGLLLYLLVTNAVRTTGALRKVVWTLIIAGAFMGAFSIVQELTHTYATDYGGLAQVDRVDNGGGFNVAPQGSSQKVLRPRLAGPVGSENRYAQIMAAVLPLALIRAFREDKRRLRLGAALCSLLIMGGLLLTFSRGAALAVGATLVVMALLRELPIRQLLGALALLTLLVALVVPDYITRLRSLESITALSSSSDTSQHIDSSIAGRKTENLAAWHTFLDHPITGVGPGVYFKEYSRQNANRLGLRYLQSERRGHSLYLELAADSGLIGLAAFIAMVGTAMSLLYRQAKRWRPYDRERSMLASSFFFALFAYLACGAFLHLSYQRYFWMLLALASSTVWALRRDEEAGLAQADRGAEATT
jgi:putative inorganic carbon (hco3(-)) transporter